MTTDIPFNILHERIHIGHHLMDGMFVQHPIIYHNTSVKCTQETGKRLSGNNQTERCGKVHIIWLTEPLPETIESSKHVWQGRRWESAKMRWSRRRKWSFSRRQLHSNNRSDEERGEELGTLTRNDPQLTNRFRAEIVFIRWALVSVEKP